MTTKTTDASVGSSTQTTAAALDLGKTRRAMIGLIVPSANTRIEPDCNAIVPKDVTVHAARMGTGLEVMAEESLVAARQLAIAQVDVVAFGCTLGSMLKGAGYDVTLGESIERASGIEATTASSSVLAALRALGVRTVAVGTPYTDEFNVLVRRFLTDNGITVASFEGLQISVITDIARQLPSVVYELGKRVDRPEADAVFLSCTNFRAVEVIEVLEQELGKPVVTSNQAIAWMALRRIGITEPIAGFGRLLRM